MEKILFFTDLHTHNHKKNNFFVYLSYQILNEILQYSIKNEIKKVVFGGDLFENRTVVYTEYLTSIKAIFKKFNDNNIDLIFVVGNHDMPYKNNTSNNILEMFEEFGKMVAGDELTKIDVIENVDIYIQNFSENFDKSFPVKETNNKKILFSHLDIIGFNYDNGFPSETGFKINDFENFDIVFNGHYHTHQKRKNIIFAGSPYQYKRDSLEKSCGFYEITLNNGNIEYNRISLDYMLPKITTINLSENISTLEDIDFSNVDNNYVKIIVENEDLLMLNTLKNYLLENYDIVDVFYEIKSKQEVLEKEEKNLNELQQKLKKSENFLDKIKEIIIEAYSVEEAEIKEKLKILADFLENEKLA